MEANCSGCYPHPGHASGGCEYGCNCVLDSLYVPYERWRPIVGFDGYEVSNLGRVRSWFRPGHPQNPNRKSRAVRGDPPFLRKLVPSGPSNYHYVILRKGQKNHCKQVHLLVLTAFRGPRPRGEESRHWDGDKHNNRLPNLLWGTHAQNIADKKRHGTYQYGEKNPYAKLSDAQAELIKHSHGRPLKAVAEQYGVRESTISRIRNGVRRGR